MFEMVVVVVVDGCFLQDGVNEVVYRQFNVEVDLLVCYVRNMYLQILDGSVVYLFKWEVKVQFKDFEVMLLRVIRMRVKLVGYIFRFEDEEDQDKKLVNQSFLIEWMLRKKNKVKIELLIFQGKVIVGYSLMMQVLMYGI